MMIMKWRAWTTLFPLQERYLLLKNLVQFVSMHMLGVADACSCNSAESNHPCDAVISAITFNVNYLSLKLNFCPSHALRSTTSASLLHCQTSGGSFAEKERCQKTAASVIYWRISAYCSAFNLSVGKHTGARRNWWSCKCLSSIWVKSLKQ